MGGEQRWSFARVIPLSSAVPVVARQPKIWIGGGPSWERAHYLWMSYNTNRRHTLTQTHMVWLSFSKATVTIWHLNTRLINWLRYLQCVCITLTTCRDGPNPLQLTQDSIWGITVHISFLCVSHARQESHVSWSQKLSNTMYSCFSLFPPSFSTSLLIFCQHSFSSFSPQQKFTYSLPHIWKNCQENTVRGEGTVSG